MADPNLPISSSLSGVGRVDVEENDGFAHVLSGCHCRDVSIRWSMLIPDRNIHFLFLFGLCRPPHEVPVSNRHFTVLLQNLTDLLPSAGTSGLWDVSCMSSAR